MSKTTLKDINSNNFIIQKQYELLKYIGGKDKHGHASGEGIPIDIVLLPDLVLDIRKYNLSNTEIDQKCIAIGGRSGRISCILAHLTELYDGIYRPHIVAKTGNLGKLLLDNEFYNKQNINDSRKLINHIVEREGEPRVTVWNDSKADFQSRISFQTNEINNQDIESNEFLREVITRSRVIYVSSIKTPNFENILKFLVREIDNSSTKIYIDCTRSDISHLKTLIKLFSREKFKRKNIEAIIISSKEKNNLFRCFKEYENIFKNLHIGILFYCNTKIEYIDKEGILVDKIDIKIDFENEDIPERFKAGFILAKAICETVNNLSNEITEEQADFTKEIHDDFKRFWEKDSIRKMILYGVGIAIAESNKKGYCDLESIFGNRKELFPNQRYPIKFETYNIRNIKHLKITNASILHLIYLSGYRRKNMLPKIGNFKRVHDKCPNHNECKYIKQLKAKKTDVFPYTAIMIDLDGTLMDSSVERNRGLSNALKIINTELKIKNHSIDFFEKYVYDNWPLFKELGKGDFRQEWNLKGWYIAYILFLQNSNLLESVLNDYSSILNPDKNPDEVYSLVKRASWRKEFDDNYLIIENNYSDLIEKAILEFNSVKLFAYKEAFDFLKSLKDSGMYKLYIVSEGNSNTQWLKLKSTGLSEFFPRAKVLTTDDAGNLNKQIDYLKQENIFVENKIKEIYSDKNKNKESHHLFIDFKQEISTKLLKAANSVPVINKEIQNALIYDAAQFEFNNFTRKDMQIDVKLKLYENRRNTIKFIEKLLKRLNTKGGISFYAAAIRAILNNPDAPLESLRDFEKLIDTKLPNFPYKFAMIGDRQKNDIEPVVKLLERERILTFRLLSGKYYKKEPYNDSNNTLLDPDYFVHTLAQAKALLLSDEVWINKICNYDTRFFCLKIEFDNTKRQNIPSENEMLNPESVTVSVGIDIILTGIQMPSIIFPLTHKICREILKEFIFLNQKIELKTILEEIGLFVNLDKNQNELIRKTRLLTSLVIDTRLQHDYLRKYLELIKNRLKEIKEYITTQRIYTTEITNIDNALNIIK